MKKILIGIAVIVIAGLIGTLIQPTVQRALFPANEINSRHSWIQIVEVKKCGTNIRMVFDIIRRQGSVGPIYLFLGEVQQLLEELKNPQTKTFTLVNISNGDIVGIFTYNIDDFIKRGFNALRVPLVLPEIWD